MNRRHQLHVPGLLCAWLLAAMSGSASAQIEPGDEAESPRLHVAEVQPRVEAAFAELERVRVFLMLRETDGAFAGAQQRAIDVLGSQFDLWHRYHSIPAVAGELTREGLSLIRHHPDVLSVQLDGSGTGGLAESLPATGVDKVHEIRGLSGKGVTVAVLDSGASTTHPALQGAIVAQHCFTSSACPPSNAREGQSAEDDHNHGSNVTGIVASRGGGTVAKGYAPGANIVSVKVLNRSNAGRVSDWVAGFDWVYANLAMLKVQVINASLCSTAEYETAAACDASESAMAAVTKKLIEAGVTITASSGNTGQTRTMTAPACNTGVIAVGASYDANLGRQPESGGTYRALGGGSWPACSDELATPKTIACFTSTAGPRLDVLAPGSQITSTGKGTSRVMFRGTSQASPSVAGLAALLLECNGALTPSAISSTLKLTGEPIMDPRTGLSYPLMRGMEAVAMACPPGGSTAGGPALGGAGGLIGLGGTSSTAPALAAGSGGLSAGSPTLGSGGLGALPGSSVATGSGTSGPLVPAQAGLGGTTAYATGGAVAGVGASGTTGLAGIGARTDSIASGARADTNASSGCQIGRPGRGAASFAYAAFGVVVLALSRRRRSRA